MSSSSDMHAGGGSLNADGGDARGKQGARPLQGSMCTEEKRREARARKSLFSASDYSQLIGNQILAAKLAKTEVEVVMFANDDDDVQVDPDVDTSDAAVGELIEAATLITSKNSSADITSASTGKDQDLTENTSVTSLVAELVNVKSASSSVEDVKVGTNACVPRGGFSSAESVANTSANGKGPNIASEITMKVEGPPRSSAVPRRMFSSPSSTSSAASRPLKSSSRALSPVTRGRSAYPGRQVQGSPTRTLLSPASQRRFPGAQSRSLLSPASETRSLPSPLSERRIGHSSLTDRRPLLSPLSEKRTLPDMQSRSLLSPASQRRFSSSPVIERSYPRSPASQRSLLSPISQFRHAISPCSTQRRSALSPHNLRQISVSPLPPSTSKYGDTISPASQKIRREKRYLLPSEERASPVGQSSRRRLLSPSVDTLKKEVPNSPAGVTDARRSSSSPTARGKYRLSSPSKSSFDVKSTGTSKFSAVSKFGDVPNVNSDFINDEELVLLPTLDVIKNSSAVEQFVDLDSEIFASPRIKRNSSSKLVDQVFKYPKLRGESPSSSSLRTRSTSNLDNMAIGIGNKRSNDNSLLMEVPTVEKILPENVFKSPESQCIETIKLKPKPLPTESFLSSHRVRAYSDSVVPNSSGEMSGDLKDSDPVLPSEDVFEFEDDSEEEDSEDDLMQQLVDDSLSLDSFIVPHTGGMSPHCSEGCECPSTIVSCASNISLDINSNERGESDTRGEFNDGLSQQLIDGEQTIDLGSIIDLNADEVGIVIDAHASTLAGADGVTQDPEDQDPQDLPLDIGHQRSVVENPERDTASEDEGLSPESSSPDLEGDVIIYSERTSSELDITTWNQVASYSPRAPWDPED